MLWPRLIGSWVLFIASATLAADAVEDKLDAAKKEYERATTKARTNLKDQFDVQSEALRNKNLKPEERALKIQTLKKEKEAFDMEGKFPTSPEMKTALATYSTALKKAQQDVEAEFQKAIDQYTKAKMDDKALAVVAELKKLRSAFMDHNEGLAPADGEFKRAAWESLFNGTDTTGWKPNGRKVTWEVEKGVLNVDGSKEPTETGMLSTSANSYENFRLRMEYQAPEGTKAALFVRRSSSANTNIVGYRVDLGAVNVPVAGAVQITKPDPKNESIIHHEKLGDPPTAPTLKSGQWVNLEVLLEGNHIKVTVNGRVVCDKVDKDNTFKIGGISLTCPGKTTYKVRSLELLALPSTQPKPKQ